MPVTFDCEQCGKHYRVDEDLAGRRARCSRCQTVFRIPQPVAALAGSTDDEYRLAALFEEEFGPLADSHQVDCKPCPSCSVSLPLESVLCIECGYHLEKGEQLAAESPLATGDKPTGPTHRSDPAHKMLSPRRSRNQQFPIASYVRGTLLSLLFALVGGALWAFASLASDYALGFLAWAVGGLAGLGMAMAHQDSDGTLAGITSALMALVGCVFSKVLYFALFFSAFAGMMADDSREYVASILAEENIRAAGQDLDDVDESYYEQQLQLARQEVEDWGSEKLAQRIALHEEADRQELIARLLAEKQDAQQGSAVQLGAYNTITQQVAQMDDTQVAALLKETPAISVSAASTGDETQLMAQTEPPDGSTAVTGVGLFLLALFAFGIFGGVFLVLGMVSAYRLGSGNIVS